MQTLTHQIIAQRLKQARCANKLKQQTVARYLGLSVSAVSGMEHGTRRIDATELYRLSYLYQRPMEWFFAPTDRLYEST